MDKLSNESKKIDLLIVDDETDFLEIMAQRLKARDFNVKTTTNGEEAIEFAKHHKFDIALIDLRMPRMSGKGALKLLKKNHKYLEIIMLTGYGSIDSAVECTKLGAFDYLEKPGDFRILLEKLKNAYETRLKKKFAHDKQRSEEIALLSSGSSPIEILRALPRIDDDEK